MPTPEPAPHTSGTRHAGRTPSGPLQIFFLRHGPAGLPSAWNGDDADRPLTTKGRKRVRRVAKALARMRIEPDLILASPFARAAETAEIVAKVMGFKDQAVVEPLLQPGVQFEDLRSILNAHPDAGAVMIVGHEPDLSTLIAALCGGRVTLQKGGIAEVHADRTDTFQAVLVWLAQPQHLDR